MLISLSFRVARHLALAAGMLLSPIAGGASYAGSEASEASYVRVMGLPVGQVLWVRLKPSVSASRIGFLPATARHIRSYGCIRPAAASWCQVRYRGTRGWAYKKYLKPDNMQRA